MDVHGVDHRGALCGIADAIQHTVVVVEREACFIQLGGKHLLSGDRHRVVDVSRTAGVDTGLDGAEHILAGRAGDELAIALKARIKFGDLAGGVDVRTVDIGLPDLNQSPANGIAATIQNASANP